ncbi:MAG: DinB family protein [Bacteroidota bacterium]|nr:DinB family protein [Bacteroidota bacterium]
MDIIPLLLKEMETEAVTTRKMLKLVPSDKLDWKPHEKSMSLQVLSVHLAELPSWVSMALTTSELDFAAMDYKPTTISNANDLITLFEGSYNSGHEALMKAKEEDLLPSWTMRSGDKIHGVMTKYEVIRHAFSQTTHHRAQLGVYLRLLNIPIPGSYGPSADEMIF